MNTGKIVQVIGPVIDVEFEEGNLPNIMNALVITNPTINDEEDNLVVEVAQHLGDNVVRCIAMEITDGLVRGMVARNTGAPITVPVGKACLGRILNVIGKPVDGLGPVKSDKPCRSTGIHPHFWNRIHRCMSLQQASRLSTSSSHSPVAGRWECSVEQVLERRLL